MSTENPVLQFSPNAPWSMVDMAAASMMFGGNSPSSKATDEELMDLDALGFTNPSPAIFNSPQSLKSWGATFSFDSSILEELLADNSDVTSMNIQDQQQQELAVAKVEDNQQQQQLGFPRKSSSSSSSSSFTDCLADALRIISRAEPDALAQVWVPIVRGNKLFLTTEEQPYSVVPIKVDLMMYRNLSTGYVFPSQKDTEAYPGLPGRVFSRLTPEWTPNVQYYDSREYLRVRDAERCDVKGSLAVPVVDPSSHSCLGVIELVTNVEKVEYTSELNTICRALQAVNLSAATEGNILRGPELSTKGREAVLAEITEVLRRVCGAHDLPLAQTWLPCVHSGVGGEKTHFFSSLDDHAGVISLFTKDAPYFLADSKLQGFHQACSEHTLEKGQGVPGKAFISNKPSFMHDVRSYTREEYPLMHYARFFSLGGAVAVRLRSVHTGADYYILEFFLPLDCRDSDKQQELLRALSLSMQEACKTLRVVPEQQLSAECIRPAEEAERLSENIKPISKKHSTSSDELDSTLHKSKKTRQADAPPPAVVDALPPINLLDNGPKRKQDRRRNVSEKTISLEVLQQYFAGSLKDAAKSIGVCPTTLKRICRQYGISRWPSRKINKVSRSLIKLQGVIDSVQGIDGAVRLNNLTGELASAAAAAAAMTKKNFTCDDASMVKGPEAQQYTEAYVSKNSSCSETDRKFNIECSRGMKRSQSCSYPLYGGAMSPPPKLEPRVHGSCAALSALQSGDMEFELPSPSPEDNCVSWSWNPVEDVSRQEGTGHCSSPYISSGDCASPPSPHEGHFEPSCITVKATFGADTIRFKMPPSFGHLQLKEEVANRFKLEHDSFSLKYLDDDAEWVMLEADADLEECLDIMKMAHSHTVKLAVKDRLHGGNTSCHSLSSVKL